MEIKVLQDELEEAADYAKRAVEYTFKKLDRQRPKVARKHNVWNHVVSRVSRSAISRVLSQRGIPNVCDNSPHTETTRFCICTNSGARIQVRFVPDKPDYRNLLEDVRSFRQRPHDFYIAATSVDDLTTIRVHGFATRAELDCRPPQDFGQGTLDRYVSLVDLHPMPQLLAILKRSDWRTAALELLGPTATTAPEGGARAGAARG